MNAPVARRAEVARTIRFLPLGQGLGQEVRGLDLGRDLHVGTATALRLALMRHRVLRLPDQDLEALDPATIAARLAPGTEAGAELKIDLAPRTAGARTLYLDPFVAHAKVPAHWLARVESLFVVEDEAEGRLLRRVVQIDPQTERPLVYLGHTADARLRGLDAAASRAVLDALWSLLRAPDAASLVTWRRDDTGRGDVVLRHASVSARHLSATAEAEPAAPDAEGPCPETLWRNTLSGLPWLPVVHRNATGARAYA